MQVIPIQTRLRAEQAWDQPDAYPLALGCQSCPDYHLCGGLHTADECFNCHDRCDCSNQKECRSVCRMNVEQFASRHQEVHGFDLDNVPRSPAMPAPLLPAVVSLIYHGSKRGNRLREHAIAVPLHKLFRRKDGAPKFGSKEELCAYLRVKNDCTIVASGVGQDTQIEPFWRLLSREFLAGLSRMGIDVFTTPNFSLSSDTPRQDNLHAMKRIALTWSEMTRAGLPTALHVNARTERDYDRWAQWIRKRSEVLFVAFEFGTGAGSGSRIDFHVAQLGRMAKSVGRPLTLILRGGTRKLAALNEHFERVILLDTTPFPKTMQRQRAVINQSDRIVWKKAHETEAKGGPLDELLSHNIELSRRSILEPAPPRSDGRKSRGRRKSAKHTDAESRQQSFGPGFEPPGLNRTVIA